ncbi:hypothetical protein F4780DRAFT_491659 [Xylariomycetidae sp. FL0641]|nr:hypothetical protein F4780DRAFT_491659 [Xylariomycetidae sp. FL0641]
MATEFIMPRVPDHQAHYFAQHYQPSATQSRSQSPPYSPQAQAVSGYQSQQISPLSTSNSTSPTSPKSYHRQRLRPLYMPAVLRPNEHPSKKASAQQSERKDEDGQLSASNSFVSLRGLAALGRLSRRSTGDSGKCMDEEWNMDLFPKPTASPTRQHWKPDLESAICDEPSCMRHFNYWTRRHHCRRCGNIFCDSHSANFIPLDQDARYNPKGAVSRACAHCYTEFQTWRSRTNSQASSEDLNMPPGSQTAPTSPIGTNPIGLKPHGHHQEVALSVPRDWNWSTF